MESPDESSRQRYGPSALLQLAVGPLPERAPDNSKQQQRASGMQGDVEDVIPAHIRAPQRIVERERCPDERPPGDLRAQARYLELSGITRLSNQFVFDRREIIEVKRRRQAVPIHKHDSADDHRGGREPRARGHDGA